MERLQLCCILRVALLATLLGGTQVHGAAEAPAPQPGAGTKQLLVVDTRIVGKHFSPYTSVKGEIVRNSFADVMDVLADDVTLHVISEFEGVGSAADSRKLPPGSDLSGWRARLTLPVVASGIGQEGEEARAARDQFMRAQRGGEVLQAIYRAGLQVAFIDVEQLRVQAADAYVREKEEEEELQGNDGGEVGFWGRSIEVAGMPVRVWVLVLAAAAAGIALMASIAWCCVQHILLELYIRRADRKAAEAAAPLAPAKAAPGAVTSNRPTRSRRLPLWFARFCIGGSEARKSGPPPLRRVKTKADDDISGMEATREERTPLSATAYDKASSAYLAAHHGGGSKADGTPREGLTPRSKVRGSLAKWGSM